MQPGQDSSKSARGKPPVKQDSNSVAKDTIAQLAIAVNMITLCIYEFFGQGDEVSIGIGVNKKIYYMAGYADVDMWLLGSIIISLVALAVIGILNRK